MIIKFDKYPNDIRDGDYVKIKEDSIFFDDKSFFL